MRVIRTISTVLGLAAVGTAAPADKSTEVEAAALSCNVVTLCPAGYFCDFGGASIVGICRPWPPSK